MGNWCFGKSKPKNKKAHSEDAVIDENEISDHESDENQKKDDQQLGDEQQMDKGQDREHDDKDIENVENVASDVTRESSTISHTVETEAFDHPPEMPDPAPVPSSSSSSAMQSSYLPSTDQKVARPSVYMPVKPTAPTPGNIGSVGLGQNLDTDNHHPLPHPSRVSV